MNIMLRLASLLSELMARKLMDIKENIQDKTLYAAVDLGSNSFHIIITHCIHDQFTVIDRDWGALVLGWRLTFAQAGLTPVRINKLILAHDKMKGAMNTSIRALVCRQ
jgi:hypothetical protein